MRTKSTRIVRCKPIDVLNKTSFLSELYDLLRRHEDPNDDVTWDDIVDFYNGATGESVSKDTIRKGAFLLQKFSRENWLRPPGDETGVCYDSKRLELEKAAVKLRDERNELSRIQRELARRESMIDLVREGIRQEIKPLPGWRPVDIVESDSSLIVHVTDLHCGIEIDNYFNAYNEDIMRRRLVQYLDKVSEIQQKHNASECYVLLGGDLLSGLIHATLRLENNMDIIKQLKTVSTALAEFVAHLSGIFARVEVYSVPGNHSRVSPKKEDNLKGENFDILVPFIMKAILKEYQNVTIHDENIEESVAMFAVRGQKVFGVHGDKDSIESVVQRLTMVWGMKPDIVLAGHRHKNGMTTVYDSRVYESGSLSGPDSYCMDRRLRTRPEQTVLVVTEDGVDCAYNVTFR